MGLLSLVLQLTLAAGWGWGTHLYLSLPLFLSAALWEVTFSCPSASEVALSQSGGGGDPFSLIAASGDIIVPSSCPLFPVSVPHLCRGFAIAPPGGCLWPWDLVS